MSTETLTEWLLRQVADDGEVARAADHSGSHWQTTASPGPIVAIDNGTEWGGDPVVYDEGSPSEEQAAHIARHDPARVLAECEALRGAIEAAWSDHCRIEGEWGMSQSREQMSAKGDNPAVVEWLALPFADRPGYLGEWAPR